MAKRDGNGLHVGYERNYRGVVEIVTDQNPVAATIEMGLKRGRPCNYPPTEQGLENFINVSVDYLDFVNKKNALLDEKKIILDVEGWATYLGTTRTTICSYQRRGGEWTQFIDWFKTLITAQKKQAAFNYQIPPVLAIFDLKNNSNYVDKTEIELDTTQAAERASLDKQLFESGLVWNESTQSFEVLEG